MLRTRFTILPVLMCAATAACGGTSDESNVENPDGTGGMPNSPPGGREWDPGTADPCSSPLDTGYYNDELCLDAPPEHLGFQLHFGPEDYDDPDEVKPYLLEAGGEDVVCQFRYTPDFEGERYTAEQHTRLRMGTHHMIIWTASVDLPNAPPDGTLSQESCQNPFEYLFTTGSQAALGEQGGILDIPLPGGDPPENAGTAKLVMPNRSVAMEMHYVNTTEEPILREGWVNTIYTDKENVSTLIDPMFFIGANINVPPRGSQVVKADQCDQPEIPPGSVEERVRILGFTGHAHANTTRVTAWIDRAATGERERVYEAYDWAEPLNAQFSTKHVNPAMGDGIRDGAHTGPLYMDPGDKFSWECEIHNQQDVTLRFGNQAYTAEMCNIFGFAVPGNGGMWTCFR